MALLNCSTLFNFFQVLLAHVSFDCLGSEISIPNKVNVYDFTHGVEFRAMLVIKLS